MLTKDLVRFKTRGNRVTPDFIDPTKAPLLEFAEQLLDCFRNAEGKTRSELAEDCQVVVSGARFSNLIARGFEKLLLDRTEFDTGTNEELTEFRRDVFSKTRTLLADESLPDFATYQTSVSRLFSKPVDELSSLLYNDLPENQAVTRFRKISAERLLYRYNAALAQWLLMNSESLTIRAKEHDAARWRPFFRHLRFHQLLAEIRKRKDQRFELVVDGPMSLFSQTKKYGLALAHFFPAVLHLSEWELEASIQLRGSTLRTLTLDHRSLLRPYSGGYYAYVPEEIQMFQQLFSEKSMNWTVESAADFILLSGDHYGFPDFTFRHVSGFEIAMELFHQWHGSPLMARLRQLEGIEKPPLIVGVARSLAKAPEVKAALENSAYFSSHGLPFREMPIVDEVLKRLESAREAAGRS